MMYSEPMSSEEHKKHQEAIKKSIGAAAKRSPTQILTSKSREMDTEKNSEVRMRCEMSRMVFEEGLEMYEDGDMSYDEFVDDLSKSLKAIAGMKSNEFSKKQKVET